MNYSGYRFGLRVCSFTLLEMVWRQPQIKILTPYVRKFFTDYIHAIPCKHTICTDDMEMHPSLCHLGKRDDHFAYSYAYANFLELTNEVL